MSHIRSHLSRVEDPPVLEVGIVLQPDAVDQSRKRHVEGRAPAVPLARKRPGGFPFPQKSCGDKIRPIFTHVDGYQVGARAQVGFTIQKSCENKIRPMLL